MKKTTTRLALVGAAIVLGAFAIALAQHDSRNRETDTNIVNQYASQPPVPIAVEGDWSSTPSVVRGNNESLPPLNGLSGSSGAWTSDSLTTSGLPGDGALPDSFPTNDLSSDNLSRDNLPSGGDFASNPLRSSEAPQAYDDRYEDPEDSAAAFATELPRLEPAVGSEEISFAGTYAAYESTRDNIDSSRVVAATSQEPITQPAPGSYSPPPAWLDGNDGLPSATSNPVSPPPNSLAPLPGEVPPLPSLPSGGASNSTALPAFPSNNLPSNNFPANSLSDTQRGAMQPTDVTNNQLPARPLNQPNNTGFSDQGAAAARPDAASSWPAARTAANPNMSPASLVSNQPGSRYLDGSQNPIMLIQKRAPDEIQVGKKATFVITVRNAGNATAHDVTVVDSIPQGVRFVDANPNERPNNAGVITWRLGEMAAGDEKTINLQLVPEAQGEIGSVASVHFAAQASVRTVATLPRVEVQIEAQSEVLIGGSQQINVTIRNSGTGVARNVRLEADIPAQLRHESGEAMLEAVIGNLRPNEVKRLGLVASAVLAGRGQCVVRAVDDDGVQAEQAAAIDVRAPQLVAAITGPSLRYLERQATYRITVQNTGTAAATELSFVAHLPAGLKFISTDNQHSSYDPNSNTVSLGLTELAAGQTAPIALTVLPVELGPQLIKFNATGDLGVSAEAKGQVMVDGLAELAFTIGQDNGTVEVGATTTYSVQVTNVGNKPDKEVQLLVQLPNGAELVPGGVNAPVEWRAEGNKLIFAPLPEMRNRDQQTFRFQVQHNQAGNHVVRTQLTSTNWPVAVVKEEGTLVYNDQN